MDRHWRELIRQADPLVKSGDLEIFCPLGLPPESTRRAGRVRRFISKQVGYPRACRMLPKADVTHLLDHSFAYLIPAIPSGTPLVATLHDLAPLRDPGTLSPSQVRRFYRSALNLRAADLVLCVSQASAEDAVRYLQIPETRLHLHPMGVDVERFSNPGPLPELPAGMENTFRILSVGSTLPRKNLSSIPGVLSRMVKAGIKPSLIRVGAPLPPSLKDEITALIGSGHFREFSGVSDATLAAFYRFSHAFFMPSLIEGFGLPVIEAMAAGCPVVCSNATSLPEVAGEAGLLFDPLDAESAAEHLIALANDADLRTSLTKRGLLRAAKFSWKTHVEQLLGIYRSLV